MTVKIEIRCDNAAFENNSGREVAGILKRQAVLMDAGDLSEGEYWRLFDSNGNVVGSAQVME